VSKGTELCEKRIGGEVVSSRLPDNAKAQQSFLIIQITDGENAST
jgi:hypothetical protein